MCIALLLLVRDLCLKLGAVVLTRDFIKGAERELLSRGADDQRPISPLDAAFSFAAVPWATSGVTPLWSPGGKPHGHNGQSVAVSSCCWKPHISGSSCAKAISGRSAMLPDTQNQWLVMRHGSFNVVTASIGLKPTDQAWHYKQWMHLKLADRNRRGDASPFDSKYRRHG